MVQEQSLNMTEIKDILNKVLLGDCRDILKDVPNDPRIIIITDPPYGINYTTGSKPNEQVFDVLQNDQQQMDFSFLFNRLELKILFGANNFYKQLPHKGTWFCWDKRLTESADKTLGSAFELAWCSKETGYYKMYRVLHGGVVNADAKIERGIHQRFHPTQKPIALMTKIIEDYTKEGDIILDPFCGSGSTLIAAKMSKRNYIGIEIDEKYYNITNERLRQEILL